ncbi:beta strand repeat-containing protein [Pelosinus propionicus]|uniref:beta strand repeat-containing protein n=1 Tax=Pelosinus propionicus TaxID=380084 RepID=UPI00158748F9|nr:YDG domain-containing protein [Pelosinus propionicus]
MQRKWKRRWQRLTKTLLPPLAAGLLFFSSYNTAWANPTGGTVVSGSAAITASGATTTVNQTSDKAIVNWQSFSIGKGETVNFVQPSASAVALNRVIGADASAIYGTLSANGKVFLINPNGILFAPGSQVSTGGLVASTLDIKDSDFLSGQYTFSGTGSGSVTNQGTITATGEAVLLGPQVKNAGAIAAKVTALGAGQAVSLDFSGDQLVNLTVDTGAAGGSATNSGTITAAGGLVVMSAGTKDALLNTVVNNSGVIRAQTVNNVSGVIRLEGGTVNVGGTLDASAPHGGDGGFIETSGAKVNIDENTKITAAAPSGKAGKWLLDPTDITVDTALADILQNTLNGGTNAGVTTASGGSDNGDITVTAPVSWSTANTLTLTADRNISINNAITSGAGNLQLNAAGTISATYPVSIGGIFILTGGTWRQVAASLPAFFAKDFRITGGTFIRAASGDGTNGNPYQIADVYGLQGIGSSGMLANNYTLANDIDASGTKYWNIGAGFNPIGDDSISFTGTFDGLTYTITDLTINRPSTNYVGLFGCNSGTIRNVGLAGIKVTGAMDVGGLVGSNNKTITNTYSTGTVSGSSFVGGLVGYNSTLCTIENSYSAGTVSGSAADQTDIGGLVGGNYGNIKNTYSTAAVSGPKYIGGLVGYMGYGTIENSYSTGQVAGNSSLGGLVGYIDNSYGGVTISNSYWDKNTSKQSGSAGGTGLSTADMKKLSMFSSWDISATGGQTTVWRIYDGSSYPLLRSFLKSVTVIDFSKTYDGGQSSGTASGYTLSDPNAASGVSGSLSYMITPLKDVGTYDLTSSYYYYSLSGLYSTQQGYDISYNPTTLTINPRVVTLTGSRTYDGTAAISAGSLAVTNLVDGDSLTLTGSGTLSGKNAGSQSLSNLGSLSLNSTNYTLTGTSGTVTINPRVVTLTGSRTYDGTVDINAGSLAVTNLVDGDSLSLSGSGTLSGRNAGGQSLSNLGNLSLDNSNYTLIGASGVVTINPRVVTLTGSRTYDGTAAISASNLSVTNLVAGDSLTLTGSGTVSSKNAGKQSISNPGDLSLNNSNYTLTGASGTVTINPATLTLTAAADSKVYDGTTVSNGIVTYSGLLAGDTVSGLSQSFDSKNVLGTNASTLKINTGYTLNDSNNGNNYTVTTQTAAGTITPANLTLTAVADSKVYDGTNVSNGIVTYSGLLAGDTVSGLSQSFDSKNVLGTNASTLKINTGYTLNDSNNGNNYTVTTQTAAGTITPANLTLTASADSKVYDGTTVSNGIVTYNGLLAGDTVSGLTQSFDSKNVLGINASTLKVNTDYTLNDGNNGSNYTVVTQTAAGTISPAALTVTANNASRYAGQVNPAFAAAYTGLATGETPAALSGSLTFGTAATQASPPGTYAITLTGSLSSPNYQITYLNGALTITGRPADPAYDGAVSHAERLTTTVSGFNGKTGSLPAYGGPLSGYLAGGSGSYAPLTIVGSGINTASYPSLAVPVTVSPDIANPPTGGETP